MPRTIGLALIYGSEEAASIEPNYIAKRHNKFRQGDQDGAEPEEVAVEDSPAEDEGGDE